MAIDPAMVKTIMGLTAAEFAKRSYHQYKYSRKTKKASRYVQGPVFGPPTKKQYLSTLPSRRYGKKRALVKKVNLMDKKIKNTEGHLFYRNRDAFILKSLLNQAAHASYQGCEITLVEAALAQLRVFDIAAPATLVQVDATAGSYHKEILCKAKSKLVLRNNYQVPCKVLILCLVPKMDTSISGHQAVINGFADIGGVGITNIQMFPRDSPQLGDLYTVKKTVRKTLKAGAECSVSMYSKLFNYDPSFVDSHALSYQKKYGAHQYLVRLEGVLGHDIAVATQMLPLRAGLDIYCDREIECIYDAGIDLKYYVTVNDMTTFTNTGVTSQVVVDNQDYSLS